MKFLLFCLVLPCLSAAAPVLAGEFVLRDALEQETSLLWLGDSLKTTAGEPVQGFAPLARKSAGKAFAYSLILPGLGQRYVGEKQVARGFYIADAAIWTAFVVFRLQARALEEDYQAYAVTFANVKNSGHSDDYYFLLGEVDTSREYEESIKSDGRFEMYPDANVAALEQYWLTNRVSDFEPWAWSSFQDRQTFRLQRAESEFLYRRSLYMVALALVNRVVSGVFAIRSTRRYNTDLGEESSVHIEVGFPQTGSNVVSRSGIALVKNF